MRLAQPTAGGDVQAASKVRSSPNFRLVTAAVARAYAFADEVEALMSKRLNASRV